MFRGFIMVNEIAAELTDEQFKKYEIMKENDMDIGDAIDLIFDLRNQYGVRNDEFLEEKLEELINKKESLEEEMEKKDTDFTTEIETVTHELNFVEKMKDAGLDFDAKEKILEKEYVIADETYEMKLQEHKRRIKWGKFFEGL